MNAWQSHPTSLLYKGWFLYSFWVFIYLFFFNFSLAKTLCAPACHNVNYSTVTYAGVCCLLHVLSLAPDAKPCGNRRAHPRRLGFIIQRSLSRSRTQRPSCAFFFFFQHAFIITSVKVLFSFFFPPFPFYYEHDHDCKYVLSFTWKNCNNACRVEQRGRM